MVSPFLYSLSGKEKVLSLPKLRAGCRPAAVKVWLRAPSVCSTTFKWQVVWGVRWGGWWVVGGRRWAMGGHKVDGMARIVVRVGVYPSRCKKRLAMG